MPDFDLGQGLAAAVVAVITAVSAYLTGRMARKSDAANTEQQAKTDETTIALSAWKELITPLQDELREAKQEISALRQALEIAEERHKSEREELVQQIKKLRAQVQKYQNEK